MLKKFSDYRNVWVEITKSEHGHGGLGWEFGKCLWSPMRDRGGGHKYALMLEPRPGDLVIHFYHNEWIEGAADNRICGYSVVAKEATIREDIPPMAGDWSALPPYYRVELKDYTPFPKSISYAEFVHWYGNDIRAEIMNGRPKFYPFNTYGNGIRTVQGTYLARCTQGLFEIIVNALRVEESSQHGDSLESIDIATMQTSATSKVAREPKANYDCKDYKFNPHEEYAEGMRMSRERYFFSRNPRLVKDAKQKYGYRCQVCGFDFEAVYGELGKNYIECHHSNPFSERSEEEWEQDITTRLDQVNVVCANCHRMLHRRKPALAISDLKFLLSKG